MDVQVFGKIKDHDFHMIQMAIDTLGRTHEGALKPDVHALTDTDWESFLHEKKNQIRGEMWGFKTGTMAFVDGVLIGNGDDFMRWAKEKFAMVDFRPPAFYEALSNQAYKGYLENLDREVVYLDFVHDKRPMGRVIFELYKDIVPDTVTNFVKLLSAKAEKKYVSSTMHRIVKNGWIQGKLNILNLKSSSRNLSYLFRISNIEFRYTVSCITFRALSMFIPFKNQSV